MTSATATASAAAPAAPRTYAEHLASRRAAHTMNRNQQNLIGVALAIALILGVLIGVAGRLSPTSVVDAAVQRNTTAITSQLPADVDVSALR